MDAVLVATPDHWHARITQDACAAGKDVYCEKPMSHTVEQAFAMAEAMQNHERIVQVGSQCRSSIVYAKAKEIFESGALGQVTAVEAAIDRNDASGAWVYPIPPDASEQTIDWNQFLEGSTESSARGIRETSTLTEIGVSKPPLRPLQYRPAQLGRRSER